MTTSSAPHKQPQQSTPRGKKRSAMENLRDALLTLAIWIGVLALLLSVAACAARALGWFPSAEWFAPNNAYTAIPDKDADSYL
jgi:predicted small lipoprotein YifL